MKKLVYRYTRHLRFRLRMERHWRHFQEAMSADPLPTVRADLQALVDAPPTRIGSKGQPDMAGLKRERARRIVAELQAQPGRVSATALATARELAALDTSDRTAHRVHLALFCVAHAGMLAALRGHLRRYVVAHISCAPRLDRAAASCASFAPLAGAELSQLSVVGSGFGEFFEFDAARQLLTVPASDAYEHLPSKVAAAWFALSLVEGVEAVLKVDDDHRLRDGAALMRGFRSLDRGSRAEQLGHLYFSDYLGAHNRAWHIGKSSDPAVNGAPYGYPGARQWATGHTGYFLNRPALRLAGWGYTYFREHFRTGLYEDMVLSDLIERLGGRLRHAEMMRLLSAEAAY
ncbi:hypothetical protein [Caldimonas tepidiphila]|uniref:hypothetical protein n=1 Tax=Caldimonas tepidiphila TaxID=2315841 RepID=UPI000E5BAB81|nr:hypothetical protein [Caldimonas tepidiphila]